MTTPTGAPPSAPPAPAASTDKPTKVLPTDRVRFEKQLDLLRAYAAASGQANKVVNVSEVANIASLNGSTVSLCNGFFVDVGFLERSPTGGFVPSPDVMAFQRAYAWNPEGAAHKLATLLNATWFMQRLRPKLAMRPLTALEAVHDLADVASAPKKYETQLYLLLDYLDAAGLVKRDGELVRMAHSLEAHVGASVSTSATLSTSPNTGVRDSSQSNGAPPSNSAGEATTAVTTAPGMRFSIDVNIDMTEISTWGPERITAFFEGVAKVLAAKAGAVAKPPTG